MPASAVIPAFRVYVIVAVVKTFVAHATDYLVQLAEHESATLGVQGLQKFSCLWDLIEIDFLAFLPLTR